MVDGEMEGGDGVATCGIGIFVSGSRCALSVLGAMPDKAVAGCHRFGTGSAIVNGEV